MEGEISKGSSSQICNRKKVTRTVRRERARHLRNEPCSKGLIPLGILGTNRNSRPPNPFGRGRRWSKATRQSSNGTLAPCWCTHISSSSRESLVLHKGLNHCKKQRRKVRSGNRASHPL